MTTRHQKDCDSPLSAILIAIVVVGMAIISLNSNRTLSTNPQILSEPTSSTLETTLFYYFSTVAQVFAAAITLVIVILIPRLDQMENNAVESLRKWEEFKLKLQDENLTQDKKEMMKKLRDLKATPLHDLKSASTRRKNAKKETLRAAAAGIYIIGFSISAIIFSTQIARSTLLSYVIMVICTAFCIRELCRYYFVLLRIFSSRSDTSEKWLEYAIEEMKSLDKTT